MGIFNKESKEKKTRSEPIGGDWSKKGREAKAYKKLEDERAELRDEFYKTQMETGVKKDIAIHQTNIEKERSDLAKKEKELHEAERQARLDEKAAKEAKYRTTKRYRAKQWVEGKEQEWALDRERKDADREERIRKREEREERESARRSRQHEAQMQKHEEEMIRLEKKKAKQELRKEYLSQHISDEPRYDTEGSAPKKPSKKAIAVAAAADIGMGLATGEVPGFTGDVVGGRKKTRSAPSKGNSGAQRKPKATQNKPKSQSTGKPKTAKGKTKTGSKTPSKPSKPRSTGKGKSKPKTTQKKKKNPPKKGKGGMWEYGGGGLFD